MKLNDTYNSYLCFLHDLRLRLMRFAVVARSFWIRVPCSDRSDSSTVLTDG